MTTKPISTDNTTTNEEPIFINDPAVLAPNTPKDSYEGRKYAPDIDGPQQKSQETDEVYVDPRKEENLPDGGKNVGELSAFDLSIEGNKI